jgi:hypothetical protein
MINYGNGLFKNKQKHRQLKCMICGRKYSTDDGSKLIYVSMEKAGCNKSIMGFAHRDCISRIT